MPRVKHTAMFRKKLPKGTVIDESDDDLSKGSSSPSGHPPPVNPSYYSTTSESGKDPEPSEDAPPPSAQPPPPAQTSVPHTSGRKSSSVSRGKQPVFSPPSSLGKDKPHLIFASAKARNLYHEFVCKRPFIIEFHVSPIEFPEVFEVIKKRQWADSIQNSVEIYPSLVQEFYSNFSKHISEEGPHAHQVFVRGTWVDFHAEVIRDILHLPVIAEIFDWDTLDLNSVAQTLTGNAVSGWPNQGWLKPTSLTPFYQVLFKLTRCNWFPTVHNSSVRPEKARFLYAVALGMNIDLASLIYDCIHDSALMKNPSSGLPFPCLLQKIFNAKNISPSSSDTVLTIKTLTAKSFRFHPASGTGAPDSSNSWQTQISSDIQNLSASFMSFQTSVMSQLSTLQSSVDALRTAMVAGTAPPSPPPADKPSKKSARKKV